jgi:RNA polymerase sigma-70 factor (ECF subfamily)
LSVVRRSGATPRQLEALYRERFAYFVRVAAAICGSPDLGHDAVQNAFIEALRHRRSFRGTGPLDAWVWRIVVNEARRVSLRDARASAPLTAEPVHAAGNGAADDDPAGIRAWVAALPARQREAVFLRYFADLDYSTIARVLEIEIGTVSATLGAAHRSLRKRLSEARP